METETNKYDTRKMDIVAVKHVRKCESYYMDDIDDGHGGVAIFDSGFMAGKYPMFVVCLEDPRQARRTARFLLKKLGKSLKIQGTYRHRRALKQLKEERECL